MQVSAAVRPLVPRARSTALSLHLPAPSIPAPSLPLHPLRMPALRILAYGRDAANAADPRGEEPRIVAVKRAVGIECTFNNCCVAVLVGERVAAQTSATFSSEHPQDSEAWREGLVEFHRRRLRAFLRELGPLDDARVYLSVVAGRTNRNVIAAAELLAELGVAWTPVDHETAHLYGTLHEHRVAAPFVALTVAGGHSHLWHVPRIGAHTLLGSHEGSPRGRHGVGRAVGAQLDACACLLGLAPAGQPDGAIAIDRLGELAWDEGEPIPETVARNRSNGHAIDLAPLIDEVLARRRPDDRGANERLAVAVQRSVMGVLLDKCFAAARALAAPRVLFGGGVAANSCLRRLAAGRAAAEDRRVHFPSRALCTDNAVMIAFTGELLSGTG